MPSEYGTVAKAYIEPTKAQNVLPGEIPSSLDLYILTYDVNKNLTSTSNTLKTNLINYFLTEPDERYLNPNYGGGLRSFIFENITSLTNDDILSSIRFQIGQFFPNVSILDLNIKNENSDIDANQIIVSITYEIINTGITDNIVINFG